MKKFISALFAVVVILLLAIFTNAQTVWVKTYYVEYPSSNNEMDSATVGPLDMCLTPDGTIITLMQINQNHTTWLVALDSLGKVKWKRNAAIHGGVFDEDCYSLHPTDDSGCVYFFRHNGGYVNDIVYRVNKNGSDEWSKSYLPASIGWQNMVMSIVPSHYNTTYVQFIDSLVELDQLGNLIRYRTPYPDTRRFTIVPDSDFVVLDGDSIFKEDFAGIRRWIKPLPGMFAFIADSTCIYARNLSNVAKLNILDGSVIWTKPISSQSFSITSDGGIIVATGLWIIKYDSSGTQQWSKSLEFLQCGVRSVIETSNKTYVAGGAWKTMDVYSNPGYGDGYSPVFVSIDSLRNGPVDSTHYFINGNANDNTKLSFVDDVVFVTAAMGNIGSKRDSLIRNRSIGMSVYATNWTGNFQSGVNFKYSDIDGNGIIDTTDVRLCSYMHYERTVSPHWRLAQPSSTDPVIRFAARNNPVVYTDTIVVDVILASPGLIIDSIYSLSFEFRMTGLNTNGYFINSDVITHSSTFGDTSLNLYSYSYTNPYGMPILTSMVICRTDHQNVSLSGDTVATLKYVFPSSTTIGNPVGLYANVNAITNGGFPVTLSVVGDTLTILGSTGIDEHGIADIKIIPNPASETVAFTFDRDGQHDIVIFNETGKEIMSRNISGTEFLLNVNKLAEGIYFVEERSSGGISRSKFIVVH